MSDQDSSKGGLLPTVERNLDRLGKAAEGIGELGKQASGLIQKVLGPAAGDAGLLLQDWPKYWRLKQWCWMADRVEAIHLQRKLTGAIPIPARIAIPLLDSASKEDDESIQELWAGLIANGTDPEKRLVIKKVFIEILSQVEPLDARLMQYLWTQWSSGRATAPDGPAADCLDELVQTLAVDADELRLSLQNLYRLGCVKHFGSTRTTHGGIGRVPSSGLDVSGDPQIGYGLTNIGYLLVEACRI